MFCEKLEGTHTYKIQISKQTAYKIINKNYNSFLREKK